MYLLADIGSASTRHSSKSSRLTLYLRVSISKRWREIYLEHDRLMRGRLPPKFHSIKLLILAKEIRMHSNQDAYIPLRLHLDLLLVLP